MKLKFQNKIKELIKIKSKYIEGTDGKYIIFEDGRVWNTKRNRLLKVQVDKAGYCRVSINCKGKMVHRLVAEAFIDNPDNKPQVNHKDAVKSNNHISNLEWVTPKENMQHVKKNRLNPRAAWCCIVKDNKVEEIFKSINIAERKNNLSSKGCVFRSCKGVINSAFDMKFRYYDPEKQDYIRTKWDTDKTLKPKGKYNRTIYCEDLGTYYNTQQECADHFNIKQGQISECLLKCKYIGYSLVYLD